MNIIRGNALSLDGSTQYASRSFTASNATDNISISLWVYLNSLPGSGWVAPFNNGATDGNGYVFRIASTGEFQLDLSFVANIPSGYNLSTATWYNLAAVRTSGTWQLYVNGVARGSTSASAPNPATANTTIGAQQNGGGTASNFVNGIIDDVRIYERAITAAEVSRLYNRGINTRDYGEISSTSLKAWYKLDELDGSTCNDSSGNGLSLTTSGSPSFITGYVVLRYETENLYVSTRPRPFAPGLAR